MRLKPRLAMDSFTCDTCRDTWDLDAKAMGSNAMGTVKSKAAALSIAGPARAAFIRFAKFNHKR
eukprot:2432793-Pyramimonas_sp.AAC.1